MGIFDIPPDPTGAGTLKIQLELNREELEQAVAFFKAANQAFQTREEPQSSSTVCNLPPALDLSVGGNSSRLPVVHAEAEGNLRSDAEASERAGGSHEHSKIEKMQESLDNMMISGGLAEMTPNQHISTFRAPWWKVLGEHWGEHPVEIVDG